MTDTTGNAAPADHKAASAGGKKLPGELIISEDVISELAGYAALESYGVVGMAAPTVQDGIVKLLPRRRLQRGIALSFDDDGVTIELHVIIENGTNLSAVSRNLADSVRYTLEHLAQIKVADVQVHVEGIHLAKSN